MFLSFKQRKYSSTQKWYVSRGFLENPYRPLAVNLTEPRIAPQSLRLGIERSSETRSRELKTTQPVQVIEMTRSFKSSHDLMGKGRIK
jgi:hypothetical protein